MDFLQNLILFFQNPDAFIKVVILLLVIMYNLFALALAFQIFTYNRLMTQTTFAPVFKVVAVTHAVLSFILLLLIIFSL